MAKSKPVCLAYCTPSEQVAGALLMFTKNWSSGVAVVYSDQIPMTPNPDSCDTAWGSDTPIALVPVVPVPPQVGVEHAAELRYRHSRPVAVMEELEAPMYVNSLFSPEISARHCILPGTERSSGGRSQRSLPFGIRR